jgi:hypothetical protein
LAVKRHTSPQTCLDRRAVRGPRLRTGDLLGSIAAEQSTRCRKFDRRKVPGCAAYWETRRSAFKSGSAEIKWRNAGTGISKFRRAAEKRATPA